MFLYNDSSNFHFKETAGRLHFCYIYFEVVLSVNAHNNK